MTQLGTFVFSLDTELAWGVFDVGLFKASLPAFKKTRGEVRKLLQLMDEFETPATWAFVGHLMIEECSRTGSVSHPDVLCPNHDWYPGHWHDVDPCTNLDVDPLWYGTDILRWVMDAKVEHDIGSHTFSHVIVGDPACTREIAYSQFAKCDEIHRGHGLELKSVIFPRDRVAHLDVLRELGVIAYRTEEKRWFSDLSGVGRRAAHLADRTLAIPAPTHPRAGIVEDGLVNVPSSMMLMARDGLRRMMPMASRRKQAFDGVRRAAERGEMFHLWLHPSDLGTDPALCELLGEIFEYVASLRDEGKMRVATMADVAESCLPRRRSRPQTGVRAHKLVAV